MKKLLSLALSLVLFSYIINWMSCKKSDDPSWSDEDKASYDKVLSIQDEVAYNLDDWFLNMDSLDAINMAQQAFAGNPAVNFANINSQGIAVQYANGMRGGLYLNPRDDKTEAGEELLFGSSDNKGDSFKSFVNQRKMVLINPHYFERSHYTDQIYSKTRGNLQKVKIDLSAFYKNTEATVDRFTELSGYGIIQIYSHGLAWPKKENITDVYLLTGETANESTSKKYWSELNKGNIPVMKMFGRNNNYFVSPKFISDHNDFSKDTVLFFGGFCYSFLGGWPDIIDAFADGAYTGYDWSVWTYKNANWSVNSMFQLSDTTADQPKTLNDWFEDSEVEKSYWDSRDERTVHIYYTGDGNLKLWDDIVINLIALSDDGAPVSIAGEAGVQYPFRCDVISNISELEYLWDIGDGSSPVSASNAVNITWNEDGYYILKVDVKDKSNGNIIGSATANVTIGSNQEVQIIAQSSDGKPVSIPGEVGVAYPFKCEVSSGSLSDMEFLWDIGTGDDPYNLSNEVNITWSEEGDYILKVDVRNKNNGNMIGSAMVNVSISSEGDLELIDYLKQCNRIYVGFGPEEAFLWEEEKSVTIGKDPGDLEWEDMTPIVWNGLNFSASIVTEENHTHSITGTFSNDGYTVNAVAEQEGYEVGHSFSYTLGIDNYPVKQPFEIHSWILYSVESNLIQNYVTTFEGRWVWDNGSVLNFTGVDWEEIERLYIGIGYFTVSNASNQFNTKLE